MKNNLKFTVFFLFGFVCFQMFAPSVAAQRRDHLTEQEIELVRDAQEIDRRMEIFNRAIERRLAVLNNVPETEKETDKWGAPPKGARGELLRDIEKILDEAISKVDDVAARDAKSEIFPVAINILADGANRFLPELKSQLDRAANEQERGSILSSIELCNEIIEASAKVPKLTEKERKKARKDYDKRQPTSQ